MSTVLLLIHIMVALALVGVVLLQRSEGGALGIGGGGGGFMTGRSAGTARSGDNFAAGRAIPGQDPHRAHEHDARQNRRTHGHVQAHFSARHHGSPRGHDEGRQNARKP